MAGIKSTYPSPTTVSLRVAQFIARHKPFVADFKVPIAVSDEPSLKCRQRDVELSFSCPRSLFSVGNVNNPLKK